jgi:hypothetical protein
VNVRQRCEELLHVALDVPRGELEAATLDESRQIVLNILKYHVDAAAHAVKVATLRDDDFLQAHNVGMRERLEQRYLAQRRHREALSLALHHHFLKRDVAARSSVFRAVDLAVTRARIGGEETRVGSARGEISVASKPVAADTTAERCDIPVGSFTNLHEVREGFVAEADVCGPLWLRPRRAFRVVPARCRRASQRRQQRSCWASTPARRDDSLLPALPLLPPPPPASRIATPFAITIRDRRRCYDRRKVRSGCHGWH